MANERLGADPVCLSIPAQVVSVGDGRPDFATVDMSGVRRQINVGMLDDVVPGDWVLVHVGFALTKIDEAEARLAMTLLESTAPYAELNPEGSLLD